MIEKIRTIYRCGHCRKWYLMKSSCLTHEKYCSKAPENQAACFDCKFLNVERDTETGYKTFECTKLSLDMHTFKAEKINHSCLGHTERMPLTCESKEVFNILETMTKF